MANVTWAVREATASEADALALVGGATFLETFSGVLAGDAIVAHCAQVHVAGAYRDLLSAGARAWLVEAEPGASPIGFSLMADTDLPGSREGDLELKRIYLLSRFHGGGAGAALMDAAVAAARAQTANRLLLGVYAKNTRAINFYRKQGFEQIANRTFDVGGTLYDDIVLARPLAA